MPENSQLKTTRSVWRSRYGFILAGVGSAVGLGNIWRFPYIAGENGGGAFVLIYFLSVILIALPILYAELLLGRSTKTNVVSTFYRLTSGRSGWNIIGVLAVITPFILLSYYSVVCGWVLYYLKEAFTFGFVGKSALQIEQLFKTVESSPLVNVSMHGLMIALCIAVIWRGVSKGIETLCKFLMPLLFLCLVFLDVIALFSPGALAGLKFLLSPNFSDITPSVILQAIGQAFFSLSLGMGIMITYGSYLSEDQEFRSSGGLIVIFGSIIAVLAGIAIFPIIFSYGLNPSAGPGLVFKTLPLVFSQMKLGWLLAIVFFTLLFFAALTSAISLLEVVVAFFVDQLKWQRKKASVLVGGAVFICGIPSALSSSLLKNITLLPGRNFFDSLDYLVANWLIIIVGLGVALFVGFVLKEDFRQQQFYSGNECYHVYSAWKLSLRFLVPFALIAVFLQGLGIL